VIGRAVVLAIGAASAWSLGHADVVSTGTDLRNAINVLAGADATLLGFLVSAGALLYAVANTRLVRNLQRTGHFNLLLSDLFWNSGLFLVSLCVCVAGLFVVAPEAPAPADKLFAVTRVALGLNVAAFLTLVPLGRNMWVLLANLKPDGGPGLE
jgi:hypothetical protein